MDYNRYYGNTGRRERVRETPGAGRPVPHPAEPPEERPLPAPPPARPRPPRPFPFSGRLGGLMKELETEDVILGLIFYLLYRETKDEDFLILAGSMLLL